MTLRVCKGIGTADGLPGEFSGELLLLLFLSLFSAEFKLDVGTFESPEFGEFDNSPFCCSDDP